MSPSEFQLRDALRDGEGDGVDAGAVIARAVRVRHERRMRVASVAAAVIVVGGIGAGASVAFRSNGSDGSGSTALNAEGRSTPRTGSTVAGSTAPRVSGGYQGAATDDKGAPPATAAPACPADFPQLALPGGGGSGQFGSDGPLFASPVAAIEVCGYPASGAPGSSTVLVGSAATEVAASLEAAPLRGTRRCPFPVQGDRLAMYPLTADGASERVVTVELWCDGKVTNGTAIRYDWSAPSALADLAAG